MPILPSHGTPLAVAAEQSDTLARMICTVTCTMTREFDVTLTALRPRDPAKPLRRAQAR